MARLTIDDLFEACPPPRNLDSIISQYAAEIERLSKIRAGEDVGRSRYYKTNELADYIQSMLGSSRDIVSFTPIELFSKIHETVYSKLPSGEEVKMEVSAPIHYGPLSNVKSFGIQTPPIQKTSILTEDDYRRAVDRTFVTHKEELAKQRFTQSDIITINRRLIERNIRCLPCLDRTAKCFRYDWLTGELL